MVKKNEALAILGLARRAGRLVVGAEESRRAIRQGVARVVVIADDAAGGQREKVLRASRAGSVPVLHEASGSALGAALGRGKVTAVAVTDRGLSSKLLGLDQPGTGASTGGAGGAPESKRTSKVRRSQAECG
ncbi:MAG: ribosomal L7Ae/L30e/S12e/Gadd45 family protein [Gemmatimonadota bacterium]|nr:ribosomal L7Ae/L30e/S12e/Gadd45 family protein [Gemmatimonadota bacterium]